MNGRLSKIRSVHTYAMTRTVYFDWICTASSVKDDFSWKTTFFNFWTFYALDKKAGLEKEFSKIFYFFLQHIVDHFFRTSWTLNNLCNLQYKSLADYFHINQKLSFFYNILVSNKTIRLPTVLRGRKRVSIFCYFTRIIYNYVGI